MAPLSGNDPATVLVADDDPALRKLLSACLQRAGYRVLPAANGTNAAALFNEHRDSIRLAVTDIDMPGMTGIELAARMRNARPGLPVLLISGKQSAPGPGAEELEYLAKPFLPSLFLRTVEKMLGRAGRPPAARPRVIVAEDDERMRERLCGLVRRHYDVVAAVGDGEAAIEAARTLAPDLILLDISMPGQNGFAAARTLRTAAPGSALLFVTQHTHAAYIEEAFRIGVAGYVLKGNAGEELCLAMREVQAGHRYLSPGLRAGAAGAS